MKGRTYRVELMGPARRAVAERLPPGVAFAVLSFCEGPLADDPRRVGKPLAGPLAGRYGARRSTYRIIYRIDDEHRIIQVLDVAHRRDVYSRRNR